LAISQLFPLTSLCEYHFSHPVAGLDTIFDAILVVAGSCPMACLKTHFADLSDSLACLNQHLLVAWRFLIELVVAEKVVWRLNQLPISIH
jgi:hypothetical protein